MVSGSVPVMVKHHPNICCHGVWVLDVEDNHPTARCHGALAVAMADHHPNAYKFLDAM